MSIYMSYKVSKEILSRYSKLMVVSVGILSLAGGCTFNPFQSLLPKSVAYGILKKEPGTLDGRFASVNTVVGLDGKTNDANGLLKVSIIKMKQIAKDDILALGSNAGMYRTTDGGKSWARLYLFDEKDPSDAVVKANIAHSDGFIYTDFQYDLISKVLLVSGQDTDKVGKIYKSTNDGDTFKEIYSDPSSLTTIKNIIIAPTNPKILFAASDLQSLISRDAGESWSVLKKPESKIAQISILYGVQLFILTETGKSYLSSGELDNPILNEYELAVILPGITGIVRGVTQNLSSKNQKEMILQTDTDLYYTSEGLDGPFTKIQLPTTSEVVKLVTVYFDPREGIERMVVAINTKIFESRNRGVSWKTSGVYDVPTDIAPIKTILIDSDDSEKVYLGLAPVLTK
jgi:hypothetical protein